MLEWVYLAIFTFELLTKVVAYGFLLHDGAYLRDAWCQLDLVVVTPASGEKTVITAYVRHRSR